MQKAVDEKTPEADMRFYQEDPPSAGQRSRAFSKEGYGIGEVMKDVNSDNVSDSPFPKREKVRVQLDIDPRGSKNVR